MDINFNDYKDEFLQKLGTFEDYKIKDITPVSDQAYTYLQIDESANQIKRSQDSKQAIIDQVTLQMWNDSSAVHNIDILEMSAVAARDQGYLGEGEDFSQAMYELITRKTTYFPTELLGDGKTTGTTKDELVYKKKPGEKLYDSEGNTVTRPINVKKKNDGVISFEELDKNLTLYAINL